MYLSLLVVVLNWSFAPSLSELSAGFSTCVSIPSPRCILLVGPQLRVRGVHSLRSKGAVCFPAFAPQGRFIRSRFVQRNPKAIPSARPPTLIFTFPFLEDLQDRRGPPQYVVSYFFFIITPFFFLGATPHPTVVFSFFFPPLHPTLRLRLVFLRPPKFPLRIQWS